MPFHDTTDNPDPWFKKRVNWPVLVFLNQLFFFCKNRRIHIWRLPIFLVQTDFSNHCPDLDNNSEHCWLLFGFDQQLNPAHTTRSPSPPPATSPTACEWRAGGAVFGNLDPTSAPGTSLIRLKLEAVHRRSSPPIHRCLNQRPTRPLHGALRHDLGAGPWPVVQAVSVQVLGCFTST